MMVAGFFQLKKNIIIESAIQIDTESWRKFTVVEAKASKGFLQLGENRVLKD